jgi:CPA2 family monovalent cation:H+ antiporter-2
MPILFSSSGVSPISIFEFFLSAVKPILIFLTILVLSKIFLARLLNFLFRYPSHELTILATIFTASVSILLFTLVGLPQAIAAFLAGVLISEQGKNLAPLSEIRPFRDLFLVLFFVLTGMLLNFQFFIDNLSLVISISLAIILVKFSVIYLILRFASYSPSASVFVTSYLSNVGEFTIVISQIALTSAAIGMQEYNLVLSVFILSLVFIPFLLKYARGGAERVARLGVLGRILPQENGGQDIKPAQIFENHVVICGHGRVGRETRSMLDLASIPYVVIDFNKKVISD